MENYEIDSRVEYRKTYTTMVAGSYIAHFLYRNQFSCIPFISRETLSDRSKVFGVLRATPV